MKRSKNPINAFNNTFCLRLIVSILKVADYQQEQSSVRSTHGVIFATTFLQQGGTF